MEQVSHDSQRSLSFLLSFFYFAICFLVSFPSFLLPQPLLLFRSVALALSLSGSLTLFHSLFSRSLHLTSSLTHAHVHTTDGMCVTYSGGILSRCIHPGGCDTWRGVTLCYDEYASESTSMQNTFSTCCCL